MPPNNTSFLPEDDTQVQLRKVNRAEEEKHVISQSKRIGLSYIDLSRIPINLDLLELVSEENAKEGLLMPFYRTGKKIRLAVLDPENPKTQKVINDLRQKDYLVNLALTSQSSLKDAYKLYQSDLHKKSISIENIVDESELGTYEEEIANMEKLKNKILQTSSLEATNYLLVGSLKTGASDIHIEAGETNLTIRYRIDGILQKIIEIKKAKGKEIVNQIKHLAHLKLNITEQPQDGRFYFLVNQDKIDVRVSTLPAFYGESIVLRILDSRKKQLKLSQLGFNERDMATVDKAIQSPNGIILCTGPTGSGKTTSLYTMLQMLNTSETKIITLEEPIEYNLPGVTQSQIRPEINYNFADALKAVLRHDPNIIMLGEIRDLKSAEIATQAAMTGHLVLSTLHTNDAISSIPRLINMGLKPFMIAPSLRLIIAQRLVRKVCEKCHDKIPLEGSLREQIAKEIQTIKDVSGFTLELPDTIVQQNGCNFCSHTGYRGQIGIYEVMSVNKQIEKMILEKKSTGDIFTVMRKNGMLTLRENGLIKVIEGITTYDEIIRVTADIEN